MTSSKSYRADVDGLRAIAVLGVVFYHSGLGVGGGYAGVDVFFVISGFLITGILCREFQEGRFSIFSFWERRIRRILPALLLVTVSVILVSWFIMLPFGLQVVGQSTVAVFLMAANIQFWRTTGYFEPVAEENPLLHTWSLSVEEQFYLILPFLMMLFFRFRGGRLVVPMILCMVVMSFYASVSWLRLDAAASFYLLPSRAWELGVGSLLAFAPAIPQRLVRDILGWFGLGMIAFTFFSYTPATPFPGVAAMLPVFGAVLVIWSGIGAKSSASSILSWSPFVLIGLASYSFYLWHWPFFAFHHYLTSRSPSVGLACCYIGISFGLSLITLRWVERPFRRKSGSSLSPKPFVYGGLASALLIMMGLMIWQSRGVPSRVPEQAARFDRVEGDTPFVAVSQSPAESIGSKSFGNTEVHPKIVLWGDSHAEVLLHAIDSASKSLEIGGVAITRGGCPPVLGWSQYSPLESGYRQDVAAGEKAYREILRLRKEEALEVVIIAFRWGYYVDDESDLERSEGHRRHTGFQNALLSTLEDLKAAGLTVLVVQEVPVFSQHVPKAMALNAWRGFAKPALSLREMSQNRRPYQSLIERLTRMAPDIQLFDPSSEFIASTGEIEFLSDDGTLLYRDQHHLTQKGSMRLATRFRERLLEILEIQSP